MPRASVDGLSLRTLLDTGDSRPSTARSSFEWNSLAQQACRVTIFDQDDAADVSFDSWSAYSTKFSVPHGSACSTLPESLKVKLEERHPLRTRWINVEGWSPGLIDDLTDRFLDKPGCLSLQDLEAHAIGGPIHCKNGGTFIWVQTSIWYPRAEAQPWSSMRKCGLRLVVCLPTTDTAATIITNFLAPERFAEKVSNAFTQQLLEDHATGYTALKCAWTISFSILRLAVQQLDVAWKTFDPIERNRNSIPCTDDLPYLLECVNDLARVDRYIYGLLEISGFVDAIRNFEKAQQSSSTCTSTVSVQSELESTLTQDRIVHAQQMCKTFVQQYENQISLMLSSNTTEIIRRLDDGRHVGDRLAWIGFVLAAMTFISTPFVMITGYYGMNVHELLDGAVVTLFDFWRSVLPVMAIVVGLIIVTALKMLTMSRQVVSRTGPPWQK